MSERKQLTLEAPTKRVVLKTTVDKWIAENDKTLNTVLWLNYEADPANRT